VLTEAAAVAFLLSFASPGRAQSADEALAALSSPSFETIRQGVSMLAVSGHPQAAAILTALQGSRLFARGSDKALFIKTDGGSFIDATTGKPAPDIVASGLKQVRLNNAVRARLDAALGSLRLLSPDARTRLDAAEAVFHSHDPAALPAVEHALARESDGSVKLRMEQARAAALLFVDGSSEPDRLDAVAVLQQRGDIDSRSLLASLSGQSPAVTTAAMTAVKSIDWNLQLWSIAQSVYYGLSLGSVLLLAAAGLAITFGVMGVINMAHGEMVMIGAYATFAVQQALRAWAPGLMDASLVLAIPAAFLAAGAVGVALERGVIRFLYGRPLETLLMTWGVSMILQQAVRSIFGPTNREVTPPSWMTGSVELASGLALTTNRVWIIGFGLAVLLAMVAVTRFTWFGLQMRAVTQNRGMARAMGVRSGRVDALTFGLGSGIAGVAGVALSQLDNVSPNLGQGYIVDSFMVVVFGGVGNLLGTLIGAMTLGVVNKFLEPLAGAVLGKILVLVAIILFIQARPRGLFALRGRAAES